MLTDAVVNSRFLWILSRSFQHATHRHLEQVEKEVL